MSRRSAADRMTLQFKQTAGRVQCHRTIIDHQNERGETTKKRGPSQCMEALARASEVSRARAALKREISEGRRNITEVITESPWEADSMSLSDLLCSQRRWGRARSRKLLSSTALSEGKRVGSLTERQRRVLVAALEAKFAS